MVRHAALRVLRRPDSALADFVVVVVVFICGAIVLGFKLYTGVWLNFSLNFSLEPWTKVSDGVCCPFFPLREACVECPSCGAVVSNEALHKVLTKHPHA